MKGTEIIHALARAALEDDKAAPEQFISEHAGEFAALPEDDTTRLLWEDVCALVRRLSAGDSTPVTALTKEDRAAVEETNRIIDLNLFAYHFQPIVSTTDGSIYAYEALMRPQSTIVPTPYHVLKFARMSDRMADIERSTFINVLSYLDEHIGDLNGRPIFINSIPSVSLSDDVYSAIDKLLLRHPEQVVVEMTEQTQADSAMLERYRERYNRLNIRTAIDDYGTGYSNVENLLKYTPNVVKIDRSLISGIEEDTKKRHFVREIIGFCHDNGILALAEGVETSDELRIVIMLGVDLIQGYYTARPCPELIYRLPFAVEHEIRQWHQQKQEGRDLHIYLPDSSERISLERLSAEGYRMLFIGESGSIHITGDDADHQIKIETAPNVRTEIVLENVCLLDPYKYICMDIGEGSDVILNIKGENRLNGGIRVPSGAVLTVKGDGRLDIMLDSFEYFGIGNDLRSYHGDLIFDPTGTVSVSANGQFGTCIGSGLGGRIAILEGQYLVHSNGERGVCIGSYTGDTEIHATYCDVNINSSMKVCCGVGSLTGDARIEIGNASVKLRLSGDEAVGLGTVTGNRANISINGANIYSHIKSENSSSAAALSGKTSFRIEKASFRIDQDGHNAIPIGSPSGDTTIYLEDAEILASVKTAANVAAILESDSVHQSGGRIMLEVNGQEEPLSLGVKS